MDPDDARRATEIVTSKIINGRLADRLLFAFGPTELDKGATVSVNLPNRDQVFLIEKPSCLFFIDPQPMAMFGHKVFYILSDRETGSIVESSVAFGTPVIKDADGNERKLYETIEQRFDSKDRFFPRNEADASRKMITEKPTLENVVALNRKRSPSGIQFVRATFERNLEAVREPCKTSKKFAIIIDAGLDDAFSYNALSMEARFSTLGFDHIESLSWRIHTLDEVRRKISEIGNERSRCDVLVIYITSHVVVAKNATLSTYSNAGSNEVLANTDGEIHYRYDKGHHLWSLSNKETNKSTSWKDGRDIGPGLLYGLRDVNAGKIEVILEMCNSGLLIDIAKGKHKKLGGPPIADYLGKHQTLNIKTSSSNREASQFAKSSDYSFAGFLLRGDTTGVGGMFTQIFSREMFRNTERADVDSDGTIDAMEYLKMSDSVFESTNSKFKGPIDGWLRRRFQNPQTHVIKGNGKRAEKN